MNTFTSSLTKEQFTQFRTAFKTLAHSRQLTSADIIVNNILRGFPEDRGFTAITNTVKLNNGSDKWHSFKTAAQRINHLLKYRIDEFKTRYSLTDEIVQQVATVLHGV